MTGPSPAFMFFSIDKWKQCALAIIFPIPYVITNRPEQKALLGKLFSEPNDQFVSYVFAIMLACFPLYPMLCRKAGLRLHEPMLNGF